MNPDEATPEPPDPMLNAAGVQHAADRQVLMQEIGPARLELAKLKIAYYAAKADIELTFNVKGASGTKEAKLFAIQKLIDKTAAGVEKLQAMYEDIADGSPIPQPEHPLKLAR